MSKEDEMIKEALKIDINASDELNRKIIENVGKKKSNVSITNLIGFPSQSHLSYSGIS